MPLLFVHLSSGFRIDALDSGCSFDIINESYGPLPTQPSFEALVFEAQMYNLQDM